MEWTTRPWKGFFGGIILVLAVTTGFLTLRFGGFVWATYWTTWLAILILSALSVLGAIWISGGLAAGADWVRYNRNWVKTYELVTVRLGASGDQDALVLKDAGGRECTLDLTSLQSNRALWDLVYNGALHSVYNGDVDLDGRAREELMLDPQLHLIYDEDSHG